MLRKTMIMASLAVAAIAFAAPGVASAKWAHHTVALTAGQNPQLTTSGPVGLTGGLGGTSCNEITMAIQLTGGGTTGHVTNFSVHNPTSCVTQGGLAFCQLHSVTFEGTNGNSWLAHTDTKVIQITKVELQKHYSGSFCPNPTVQLHGEIVLTPDAGQPHTLHQGQISGTLQGTSCKTPGNGCNTGPSTVTGSWTITPAKTYGVT